MNPVDPERQQPGPCPHCGATDHDGSAHHDFNEAVAVAKKKLATVRRVATEAEGWLIVAQKLVNTGKQA